jgi:hypothetical protein
MIGKNRWKSVRSFGSSINAWRGPITAPVWEIGQKSSISYIFGCRDPMETRIAAALGERIYFLVLGIVLFGAKLSKVDMFQFRDVHQNGKIKLVP